MLTGKIQTRLDGTARKKHASRPDETLRNGRLEPGDRLVIGVRVKGHHVITSKAKVSREIHPQVEDTYRGEGGWVILIPGTTRILSPFKPPIVIYGEDPPLWQLGAAGGS
jgi:hypothetical protein